MQEEKDLVKGIKGKIIQGIIVFFIITIMNAVSYSQSTDTSKSIWTSEIRSKVQSELKMADKVIDKGLYKANWESLENFKTPEWYKDGKFGIFIHWGVYSVPAAGSEWYPRQMYQKDSWEYKHHIETYGPQSTFGYKDFIPQFKAEKFNPAHWAELFKKSGAKYIVPVAEHHDGFAMYDCSFTDWKASTMGPKRDIIGELSKAVRKQGLVFGLSSHRAEHWWFMNGGRQFPSDVQDPKYYRFYGPAASDSTQPNQEYLEDWLARTCELVDKYQPQLVYFDWWIEQPVFQPYLKRFAAFYYDRGKQWKKEVAIDYKNKSFPDQAAVLDIERGQLTGIRPEFWQTDNSVSYNSWGYVKEQTFMKPDFIIGDLVDIVSKNGALLLNIGPKPDGTIPEEEENILLDIGKWLGVNGEAIYNTRPWVKYGEGPTEVIGGTFNDAKRKPFTGEDIRFTIKDKTLYAIFLDWPGEKAMIKSLGKSSNLVKGKILKVDLLGCKEKINWTLENNGLVITLPKHKPCDYAYTVKITGLKW